MVSNKQGRGDNLKYWKFCLQQLEKMNSKCTDQTGWMFSLDCAFISYMMWKTLYLGYQGNNPFYNYTQRQWKVTSIKVSIFRKINDATLWLLLRSCLWSTTSWFGEIKQLHDLWNYGARDARAFMFFAVFNNLKSSVSEDNTPEHALDIFIENATKMF